ncbi:hypothetical protein FHS83_003238 [Rhizomicrobium palustre]|uniref:LamG-like jellyroll fold domain-containing protein n=1 Tax=Rhizomicrobium palustre TaxID=189966 RepID=A0A846N4E8_9PROT|nr:LamG domain-containing protein [Rhizomicrobium palustre]NIK89920.1 hypothetical protein [Rhizomicrobium palustre]
MKTTTLARFSASLLLATGVISYAKEPAGPAPGLLFYMSADKSLTADFARGEAVPNFSDKFKIVNDGRMGSALATDDENVVAWKAPGNIFAQRGTVSFFWRARTPLGRAPFVLFRTGFADHSSWDMAFLRIDYNGHGYDAFVTDNNLARVRVSFKLDELPAPNVWNHIAFSWDETSGVKLYVNGKLVAEKKEAAVLDSGLDQFGMAARAVSPHQVQSRYNFMRGSDYDELRIYDHAVSDAEIATLAKGDVPQVAAFPAGDLSNPVTQAEWFWRYGWNRAGDAPVALTAPVTAIRKVEFTDAKDIKEWMYKATDGIAETTWPGVYNRSRLPGRNDYFQLPDWNVYVEGGKTLTLTLPNEPWNHIELQGAAYGNLTYAAKPGEKPVEIATRAKDQERSYWTFDQERKGGVLSFNNIAQETPIQEIAAYNIQAGSVPKGTLTQTYTIRANAAPDSPDLDDLNDFIKGRYTPDAQTTVVAVPDAAQTRTRVVESGVKLPLIHVLIPYEYGAAPAAQQLYRSWGYGWENMHDGLDGIAITIPALKVKPTMNGLFPLNIQVKDPIWPMRNMFDITVAVKPGEARTVWLDLRDRILPNKSLYLTVAGSGSDFDANQLNGAKIKLVFKDRKEALKEHIADRLDQLKDNWGYLVEEHTASKREKLYERVVADATDLLRVDPDNKIGREYWADITYGNQGPASEFNAPKPPKGVPSWAFLQLEDMKGLRHFINWWIDNRQSDYGDFGGGISDDSDLLGQWPGAALLGIDSDKIKLSLKRLNDAVYKNGMITNGLSTIMSDELHVYEEGINVNSESMYLNFGDPKAVERLMTTVAAYERIISTNSAGHLHFNTNWYSGSDSFREGPWEWGKYYSYVIMHPGVLMGDFNADPTARKTVIGLADGILAHGKKDDKGIWWFPDEINWRTEATKGKLPAGQAPMQIFWAAWRWTGDDKYLMPILASVDQANKVDSVSVGGARVVAEADNIKPITNLNEDLVNVLGKQKEWGGAAVRRAEKGSGGALERYVAWEMTGNKKFLDDLYTEELRRQAETMYSRTEGHWWTDRVEIDSMYLQRSRMGGVQLVRGNMYPGATVTWAFPGKDDAVKVALLVPNADRKHFKVIAFNTDSKPIKAKMTGWNVESGIWTVKSGLGDALDNLGANTKSKEIAFEKSASTEVEFAPGKTTVYEFTLKTPSGSDPVTRADLGIGEDDVVINGTALKVTVHSLGAQDAGAAKLELVDAKGKVVAEAPTPAIAAPKDLKPHTATVTLALPAGFKTTGAKLRIVAPFKEITQMNNEVVLK